jgi:hypothetical protein
VREELAEHLTLLTDEYARARLPLDEARRRAKLKLVEQMRPKQSPQVIAVSLSKLGRGFATMHSRGSSKHSPMAW